MRALTYLAIGCLWVVGTAAGAHAQSVDVSGTWQLDPSRSDAPWFAPPRRMVASAVTKPSDAVPVTASNLRGETVTIALVGDQLTVERSHGVYGPRRTVRLDGASRRMSDGITLRGFVEGDAAITVEQRNTVTLPDGRTLETLTVERFSRPAAGTLLYERRSEHGDRVGTWRFLYEWVQ